MPSFNTEGKSKEDLALVAQLAGLLTLDQTSTMTRTQIARVIERENRKLEAAAHAALQPETAAGRPARGRKAKTGTAQSPIETGIQPEIKSAGTPDAAAINEAAAATAEASVKKTAGRTRRNTAAAAVQPSAEAEIAPASQQVPAEQPAPAKTRRVKQPAVASKTSRKKKEVAIETAQVTLPDLPAEIPPSADEKPLTATSPDKAIPIPKVRKRPGRKPADPINGDAADAASSSPAVQETEKETLPEIEQPVSPALPGADPGDAVSDRSPEAAEAAADKQEAPTAGRHVPPHHTLTARQTGRRRTRIIGLPAAGPAEATTPDDTAAGSATPIKSGRPAKAIHAESPTQEPEIGTEAPETVEPAANSPAGEAASATIVQLPVNIEHSSAASHRPAVEAGDLQAGVLEIMPDGYGFLRKENYLQGSKDIYVPPQYIRRFNLRMGDYVSGPVKLQRENDRYQALLYIKEVNGMPPEKMIRRPHFDRLTPIYPNERFVLETVRNELSTRIIDLVAPIGKGQRGMIVSPPKAGKTILLQKIANAISINNPDVKLIVLLIDERPEEVTDMQRSIKGEVVYSTFDKTPENHTKVTELVLERAMRLVELKQDVVILLDSMTRLARAYNLSINPTGRTLSGGLDPGALYGPKRFFGAARNIENGGSLTIIATSLIETGSRMDEVIFEEFKGTGNMEVYLDRKMSEKRIFPAIDINKSGTRREELLMSSKELDAVWTIRKAFSQLDTSAVTEAIINLLLKTNNNQHFIASVNVSFNDKNVFEAMRGVKPSETAQAGQSSQTGSPMRSGVYGGYNSSGQVSNYRRMSSSDDD